MNKRDLVTALSKVLSTQTESKQVVEHFFKTMREALRQGDKVVVQGFGSFHVVVRRPKKGRNPRTGETVPVPARRKVKFRAAKDLLV